MSTPTKSGNRRTKWVRRGVAAITAVIIAGTMTGCTTIASDTVGLYYDGGSFEGNKFNKIIEPGSGGDFVWNDNIYELPINQRTFNASNDKGADSGPITVPGSDQTVVRFSTASSIVLNTRTEDWGDDFKGGTLRKFFEAICKHYKCYEDDGWKNMLNAKLQPSLYSAFKDVTRGFTGDAMVYNVPYVADVAKLPPAVCDDKDQDCKKAKADKSCFVMGAPTLDVVKCQVGKVFIVTLEKLLGGRYFCGPAFDRNNKADRLATDSVARDLYCPPIEMVISSVDYENANVQTARDNRKIAAENGEARKVEAAAIEEAQGKLAKALADPRYLEYLRIQNAANKIKADRESAEICAKSGKDCRVIIGGNTGTSVPVG